MKTATVNNLLLWEPCWPVDKIRALAAKHPRERWTALDVLQLVELTPEEKLWVVLRPELLDDQVLRLFACDCAEAALCREREAGREPDTRSWTAVAVSRRFALGEASAEELEAAGAAGAAAGRAAWAAAWAAASKAAGAAREAARAAAWAAAGAAAWAVASEASEAAREAAREEQVQILRRLL